VYACPNCTGDNLAVNATQCVTAYIDREGNVVDEGGGDTEWEDDAYTRCADCGIEGVVSDFWLNSYPWQSEDDAYDAAVKAFAWAQGADPTSVRTLKMTLEDGTVYHYVVGSNHLEKE
jgi:hypothetical protein